MSKQLEGSSPRRLIKRTHNRNPTFHSFNLFGVLQPDQISDSLPSEAKVIRKMNSPSFSYNAIVGVDVSPHKKQFIDSYLPPHRKQYLAERGQKSLRGPQLMENSIFAPRSKSSNKIQVDSLHQAEDEFTKNKLRNPQYFISGGAFKVGEKTRSRVVLDLSPSSKQQNSIKRCRSIIQKQSLDYNIISNLSRN